MVAELHGVRMKLAASSLRLAVLTSIAMLSMSATCQAPAVTSYHEDLPAYAPAYGPPESRFGYHRAFWTNGSSLRPREYFDLGLRVGQRSGRFAFEEGLTATLFESWLMFGPGLGASLVKPLVALRASWMPASVAGRTDPNRLSFSFQTSRWWQVSVAAGTPYRPHGLGWSAGARATKQGIGPLLTGEFGSGALSLRTEASFTVPSPWADTTTKGMFFSIGIGAAHHGRN
jgi:hypothetical protein